MLFTVPRQVNAGDLWQRGQTYKSARAQIEGLSGKKSGGYEIAGQPHKKLSDRGSHKFGDKKDQIKIRCFFCLAGRFG
jgi:hypothetical protein